MMFTLLVFFIALIFVAKKSKEKFVIILSIVPSIVYFFITVKMTSFQELRYIMPVIPFICIILFLILDTLLEKVKYKNTIMIILAIILSLNGFIFSKPKFLFEEYNKCLEIAEQNRDKSFVYVYDNFFNHMQSMPEFMIYEKSLVINDNMNELQYVIDNYELNNENSYILCIKSYMNNDDILDKIKNNTDFKNITQLYKSNGSSTEMISNNLYLVSK